ncbi:MAG: phytoene desaturase family protein, partial [Rubripirellula sp.]
MIAGKQDSSHVIVVGAGLGGLASACVLAARGHRVTLLDKNDWVGGKAASLESDGYRFDMGPTILTLPSVLRKVFDEAGRNVEDYIDMVKLDPQWRCFFEGNDHGQDNAVLDLVADTTQMQKRIDEFTGSTSNGEGYREFLKLSEQLHGVSDRFFFWRSVGGLRDTMEV